MKNLHNRKMKIFIAVTMALLCSSSEGSKEDVTPIQCDSNSYRCADNSKCVQGKDLCDYHKDCDDLSDETFSMCRNFQERRGSCTSGTLQHPNYGCQDISTICSSGYYNSGQFLPLCNEIQSGLKPMEDFTVKDEEISKLREKLTALQNESKIEDIFEHLATSFNETIWLKNDSVCPPLYVNIGGKCMAFFTVAKVNWAEAKQFCESISGTLAILRRMKDYESLLKHLKSQDLTTDFWIGGHYSNLRSSNSSAWTWLDEKEIVLGAPFWSLYKTPTCTTRGTAPECYKYSLAPRENRDGFCLALDYAFHYYFIDKNCHEKRSPLCFLNEK